MNNETFKVNFAVNFCDITCYYITVNEPISNDVWCTYLILIENTPILYGSWKMENMYLTHIINKTQFSVWLW